MNNNVVTVTQLNKYIATLMSFDELLCDISLKGEISNFKLHSSGHMYFSLKDADSKIKCVMFKGNTFSLRFEPEDGMNVVLTGRVGVYEKNGEYQVYVNSMRKDGIGELFERYTALLAKLKSKGYFDESVKKPIPYLPHTVAVVTSPTGAAVRDIISVIKRRCVAVKVIVCPVLVQGAEAAESIAEMIDKINANDLCDVIIVARGGGSIEELWAFNEEVVAESIFKSKIPVISGVGHETDFTITDFVSDIRAATPSAAAELAVPDAQAIKSSLNRYKAMFYDMVTRKTSSARKDISLIRTTQIFADPYYKINNIRFSADTMYDIIQQSVSTKLERLRLKMDKYQLLLRSMSHEEVLKRGYFAVKKDDNFITCDKIEADGSYDLWGNKFKAKITVDKIGDI